MNAYPQRGSASVLVVAAVGALVLLTATGLALGAVAVTRHRAAAVADLAALAAASRPSLGARPAGCAAASMVAAAQGAVVVSCALADDASVELTVAVSPPGWVGRLAGREHGVLRSAHARARAGTGAP